MAKLRSTLPEDFAKILDRGNEDEIAAVFRVCEVNARGGHGKQTALAFDRLPDGLAHWLVQNGADLEAGDTWGNTPLHNRARSRRSSIGGLLALGANVHRKNRQGATPLHTAADSFNAASVRLLLKHGARIEELDAQGFTPLEAALRSCQNIDIVAMVEVAKVLLDAGARQTSRMSEFVTRIGKSFEFHRSGFNRDSVDEFSAALVELYDILGVAPVPPRRVHDGKSTICVTSNTWQSQHQELWELLVPSSGPAETMQGEVIRLSGKIFREIEVNGGVNWDSDYAKTAGVFVTLLESGQPLKAGELSELREIVRKLNTANENTHRMVELAVQWVLQNPEPIKLAPLSYKR